MRRCKSPAEFIPVGLKKKGGKGEEGGKREKKKTGLCHAVKKKRGGLNTPFLCLLLRPRGRAGEGGEGGEGEGESVKKEGKAGAPHSIVRRPC
jgi:hypothetical protein